ncbi:MAG: hypothetical protein PHT54_03815 [Candidatus Nanoarchaeia archaeon]|nr:hypothetical protein [Candidatus Nanoarchaeia archaeon]
MKKILFLGIALILIIGCATQNVDKDAGTSTANPSRGIKIEALGLEDYREISSGERVPWSFRITNNMPDPTEVHITFNDGVGSEYGGIGILETRKTIPGILKEDETINQKNYLDLDLSEAEYHIPKDRFTESETPAEESFAITAELDYDVYFTGVYRTCVGSLDVCSKKEGLASTSGSHTDTYPISISRIERRFLTYGSNPRIIFDIYFAEYNGDSTEKEINNIAIDMSGTTINCNSNKIKYSSLKENKVECSGSMPSVEEGFYTKEITVSFNYNYKFTTIFDSIIIIPVAPEVYS